MHNEGAKLCCCKACRRKMLQEQLECRELSIALKHQWAWTEAQGVMYFMTPVKAHLNERRVFASI